MPTLEQRIDQVRQVVAWTRQRLRQEAVASGVALSAAVMLGLVIGAVFVDMVLPMSVPVRVAVATLLGLVLIGLVLSAVIWPWLRPLSLQRVAFQIERYRGGMHNRLVTVLDMARGSRGDTRDATSAGKPPALDTESPFVQRVVHQASQEMESFDPTDVANARLRKRLWAAAGIMFALAVLVVCLYPNRVPRALARLIQPTADIAPPTGIYLVAQPGDTHALRGQPITLSAQTRSGQADSLAVRLRTTDAQPDVPRPQTADSDSSARAPGTWRRYPMESAGNGQFTFDLTVDQSYEYQLLGAGTWSTKYHITRVDRPLLVDLSASIRPPRYMPVGDTRTIADVGDQISAPTGSTVELAADIAGDPRRVWVQLFEQTPVAQTKTQRQETVWFDDRLPPDSVTTGSWQWVDQPTQTGSRSHTFNWAGKPHGFLSRLKPLTIAPESKLAFAVRVDAHDTPTWLRITLEQLDDHGKQRAHGDKTDRWELVWGPKAKLPEKAKDVKKRIHVGELPKAGQWHQLLVPRQTLPGKANKPLEINGLRFEIDSGRAWFDRVGTVKQTQHQVTHKELNPAGRLRMHRRERGPADAQGPSISTVSNRAGQADQGQGQANASDASTAAPGETSSNAETTTRWVGGLALTRDMHVCVVAVNRLGYANQRMEPIKLLATSDQGPSLVVERPGQSVTLAEDQALPLVVRAFDDLGIKSIALAHGPNKDKLDKRRRLAGFAKAQGSRSLITTLKPSQLALKPGKGLSYRIIATDYKGQTAASQPYRLALADPDQKGKEDQALARKPGATDKLMQGVGELIKTQGELLGKAASLIPDLPADLRGANDANGLSGEDLDKLSDEQVASLTEAWKNQLSESEQGELADLSNQLRTQRGDLEDLAKQLDQAAKSLEDSPLSMPGEAQAMGQLADQAQALAQSMPEQGGGKLSPEMAKALAKMQSQQGSAQTLAQMRDQLEQLQMHQQALAQSANGKGPFQQMLAQARAERAAESLGELSGDLESRQQRLKKLREQMQVLQKQTGQASAQELNQLSKNQQELEAQTLEMLKQNQQLMRQLPGDQPLGQAPPAPWNPPAEAQRLTPRETDTPAPSESEAQGESKPTEDTEQTPWWDQPIDTPLAGPQGEVMARYKNRGRDVQAQANASGEQGEKRTPRQRLQRQQKRVASAMRSSGQQLSQGQAQVQALQSQLKQALASGNKQAAAQAASQLRRLMRSRAMSRALGAARMTRMNGRSSAMPSRGRGFGQGRVRSSPAVQLDLDALGASAAGKAGTYRLPPEIRQPLIQGMQERGPTAYQPLIEAYYRQLSDAGSDESD